jgi:predicted nucleotide-binding protein
MLNMSELIGRHHPVDETVEQFCMERMSGTALNDFESHLLPCLRCQYRVAEMDQYVLAMRGACAELCPSHAQSRANPGRSAFMRNVFISHGGPSFSHVHAVRDLLNALGLVPVIVQQLPSVGQSVHGKVQGWMRICRSAIVLATADDESVAGDSRIRPNIEHEIGMLQTIPTIQNRIVYLKEPSVRFPSNYAEKVWIEFSRERVQDAFIPLIRELRAFAF